MQYPSVGARLELVELPLPEPGPDQVRVKIEACGVCGSDLLVQKGAFGADCFPLVPGHEAAGTVDSVGHGVETDLIGRQAALWYVDAPADSAYVKLGRANIAPEGRRMGMHVDGGFAEYVVRPAKTLIFPPQPIEPAVLAVLTDAVATPVHALRIVAKVKPAETVVVLGIGGVGSNAVQIAKHLGARVVAVSRSEAKLELAKTLGADEVVQSGPNVVERTRAACGGYGPEVVVQCAGSAEADQQAVGIVAPGGRVVFVGASMDEFRLTAFQMVIGELSLLGSRGFTPEDIREGIDLYLAGTIRADHLTTSTRPLEEANDALDDLRHGRSLRTVLVP
ncbi:MAG: alcohol dehydrogenase catalytic domain-containing protein [Gaiellaceae bacterium]